MVLDGDDVRCPPVAAGSENAPVRHLSLLLGKSGQRVHFRRQRMIFSFVGGVSSSGEVQVPDRRTCVGGDGGSTSISVGDLCAGWDSETDCRAASVAVKRMSRVPEICKSVYFNVTDISNSGQILVKWSDFGQFVSFWEVGKFLFGFFLKISKNFCCDAKNL